MEIKIKLIILILLSIHSSINCQEYNYGLEVMDSDILISGRLNLQTNASSIMIGDSAGIFNENIENVFVGYKSGILNISGGNTMIGSKSGILLKGANDFGNTMIGCSSGSFTEFGMSNTLIGSLSQVHGGNNNVVIGSQAGTATNVPFRNFNNNVLIGYRAGRFLKANDEHKLVIDSNEGAPLIYGEFDTNSVEINGSLKVTDILNLTALSIEPTSPTNGDIYLDDGTNTDDTNPGLRWFNGGVWIDI